MPDQAIQPHYFARPFLTQVMTYGVIATMSFASGFWTSRLRDEDRLRRLSEERFREFLKIGVDMGFVTVDMRRLNEIACDTAGSEWEDAEATEGNANVAGADLSSHP